MKKTTSLYLAAATSLSFAIGAATPAVAGPKAVTVTAEQLPQDSISRAVSYADLNLAAAAGVKTLDGRISRAVRQVCAPLAQRHMRTKHSACRTFAWNGAKPQMARAIARAQQLASQGFTSIAPVAIVISAPTR